MATGRVKWFDHKKGFGFIIPDDGTEELFLHFSEIRMDGFKKLNEDDKVSFDMDRNGKGAFAKNVRKG